MLYRIHELNRSLIDPATHLARAYARMFSEPGSWLAQLPGALHLAAGCELFYRLGKRYEKPSFGIESVEVRGERVSVVERAVTENAFCRLLRFERHSDRAKTAAQLERDPVVLVVAPLSGHHATLLREAVRTLLSGHTVYVTDWVDARVVPVDRGPFSLEDYVGYLLQFVRQIGAARLHVMAVCQAAVPALATVALLAAAGEPQPRSLTLMAGPIDPRRNPTRVNELATSKPLAWFDAHLLHEVPSRYPGRGRRVYPGFLQHASFVAMNPVRHLSSHWSFFEDLSRGNLDGACGHREFYDEYNAVLDMAGEYYLDCIRVVFQEHLLPEGRWRVAGERVRAEAITGPALLTVEGELDDITGPGQTRSALELCSSVPGERKRHLGVAGAGHYGIFSGRRWREVVYPQVRELIAAAERA